MIERIFNIETSQTIERPYTAEEIVKVNEGIAEATVYQSELDAKFVAKESGKAKLAALGLTEEEVNAILGGI